MNYTTYIQLLNKNKPKREWQWSMFTTQGCVNIGKMTCDVGTNQLEKLFLFCWQLMFYVHLQMNFWCHVWFAWCRIPCVQRRKFVSANVKGIQKGWIYWRQKGLLFTFVIDIEVLNKYWEKKHFNLYETQTPHSCGSCCGPYTIEYTKYLMTRT